MRTRLQSGHPSLNGLTANRGQVGLGWRRWVTGNMSWKGASSLRLLPPCSLSLLPDPPFLCGVLPQMCCLALGPEQWSQLTMD